MKGQFSLVNIIGLALGLIVYLLVFVPMLSPIIDNQVAIWEASPTAYTPLEVAMLQMIPFFMLLGIVVTIFRYAAGTPQQNQYMR